LARLFEMGLSYESPTSDEAREALRTSTWKRLAALRKAEQLGITVSDTEIAELLRQDPTFTVNGVFDKNRYLTIIQERFRIPVDVFEEYMRQEMILQRLISVASSMVLTPPAEVAKRLDSLTDLFTIEYGLIAEGDPDTRPDMSEAEAIAFFESNTERFAVPDQVKVRYVAFPFSNYLGNVEISEIDIVDYYEEHEDLFATQDTNGFPALVPIEEARPSIVAVLRERRAAWMAKDAASSLVVALTPDRYESSPAFADVAAGHGLMVETSAFFAVTGPVAGLAVGDAFTQAAFALQPHDPDRCFSDAVLGDDAAYVLADDDRIDAHIPTFEAARDRILPVAREALAHEAFMQDAEKLRKTIVTAVTDGAPFAQAAQAHGVNLFTNQSFSVYADETPAFPFADKLIMRAADLEAGSISEPIPVEGGAILVHVMSREAGDPAVGQTLQPQLVATIERYRSSALFRAWGDAILDEANLEDLSLRPGPADAEAAE
jgi:hypothetical protein